MKTSTYSLLIAFILPLALYSQKPIHCMPNKFWAISSANGVEQFTLSNGTATLDSTVIQNVNSLNLAFCDNLDVTSGQPTFYNSNNMTIEYYDGLSWSTSSVVATQSIYNGGGSGPYLYFLGNSTLDEVLRYTGTALNLVYSISPSGTRKAMVADIAADDAGNVWLFTGAVGTATVDSLIVISPTGQMLSSYPVNFDGSGAYGCFLLNGIMYVGFGTNNPHYGGNLLPITISGGSAFLGTPIPMPAVNYADLASCNSGAPLGIGKPQLENDFSFFPNPAGDVLFISTKNHSLNNHFVIYSIDGKIQQKIDDVVLKNFQVDIQSLASGVYVASCENDDGVLRKVFVKE